jgi:Cytoplasmic N-terminal domain of rhomboid serine protease
MRLLTTLPDERSARRFEQFLLALPLPCSLEQTPNGWNLWIEREDDLDRARTELLQFQADPANPRYAAAAPQARALQKQQQEREQRLRENYIDYRTSSTPGLAQSFPVATYILIALCLLFAALTQLGS